MVLSTLVAACDDGDDDSDTTTIDGGNRFDGGGEVADAGPDARNESPPVAVDGTGTTSEDVELAGQLEATDPDGNALTFTATGQPMHGTLEVDADGSFTYTPAAEYAGPDEFTFTVSDGAFSDTGTFAITVEPVNDPPRIVGQADLSTIEDTQITLALGDVTIEDPDSDPTGFVLTVMDGGGYSHLGNVVTPVADFSGTLQVQVVVEDGDGASSPVTQVAVDVMAVNDPPRILGQNTVSTSEDQPRTLTLADLVVVDPDDTVPGGLTLSVGAGANYTVSGTTVTPTGQFTGTLTVPVTVSDGDDSSAPFNLSVLVNPANDAPVIVGQKTVTIAEDSTRTISLADLTVNDPDDAYPGGFTLAVLPGTNYTVAGATITPAANFSGTLAVNVRVNDGDSNSNTFALQVTVTPVNDPPTITGQTTISTPEETPRLIAFNELTVVDPDNTYPTGFTMTVLGGTGYTVSGRTITPAANFVGTLTVPVRVTDGALASNTFNLTVAVTAQNDAPVITSQDPITIVEDGSRLLTLGDLNVTDPDDTFPAGFTLEVDDGPNYSVTGATVIPADDFAGTLTVPVRVNDGSTDSNTFPLVVTVTPVNDAPVITGQRNVEAVEDTPRTIVFADLLVTDVDDTYPTGFTLTVLPGTNYTVSGTTITPAPNYTGPLTVPVRVNDGAANSNTFNLAVMVTATNDPPVIVSQDPISTAEDTPRTLLFTDLNVTDGDDTYPTGFSLVVVDGPNYSVSGATVIPALNFSGSLTVPVRVNDGVADSNQFNLLVTVSPVNDAPVITGDNGVAMAEDASRAIVFADLDIVDPDDAVPAGLTLSVLPGTNYTVTGTTISPADDFVGTLTVNVRVNDGAADSNTYPLPVTVNPANDAPVITAQAAITITEDSSRTIIFADLTVVDVDDDYPSGFTLAVLPGTGYTVAGTTITPTLNRTAALSVNVRVNDGAADSNVFPLVVNITPVNDAPVIVSQNPVSTAEETARTIVFADLDVTDVDDTYPTGFTLSVGAGANYTVSGTTITPAAGFVGTLTVPVQVSDGQLSSNTFNLSVSVSAVNDPPLITGQATVSVAEDGTRTIAFADLTVSDDDDAYPAGFTLTVVDGTNYSVAGTTISPDDDYFGPLSVPVRVNDGQADSNTFNLAVTVTAVNDAPVITGQDPLTIPEEGSRAIVVGDLTVVDPDDTGFTVEVTDGPNYSVAGTTVTADANFVGTLSVTVRVNDGDVDSANFPLAITVTAVNDAPQITGQDPITIPEEGSRAIVVGDLTVVDPDDTVFTVEVDDGANYSVAGTTITADANFVGTLSVPVRVNDGAVDSNTFSLIVTVANANDPPQITGQDPISIPEEGSRAIVVGDLTVVDPDDTMFSVEVDDGPNFSVAGTTITADANFVGTLSVPVRVNDGTVDSNTFALAVTVTAVNDAPQITGQDPISIAEEGSRAIAVADLTVVDPDDSTFSVEVDDGPNFSVAGTTITADANFVGTLSVPVRVNDGDVDSNTFSLQITVTAVNDAPTITASDPITIAEEASRAIVAADLTIVDVDDTVFTVEVDDGPNFSVVGTTVTADADFVGTLNVPVRVNDGAVDSNTFTVIINVAAVNDAPAITGQDAISIDEDSPRAIVVGDLTVDDPDDTVFTVEVDDGANYSVAGTTVTPDANYSGPLSVTVRVNDGTVDSANFSLAITVDPVNDAPEITGQDPLSTPEDTGVTIAADDLVVADPDDTAFTVEVDSGDNYSVEGATVTPDVEFVGTLNVPVRVNDGDVDSSTFLVAITVTPVDDTPTATADTASGTGNTLLTVAAPGVLANDSDSESATLSASVATNAATAQGGVINVAASGGFTYLPPAGFEGSDSFVYTVNDGSGGSATGTITFTVGPLSVWYVRASAPAGGDGRSTAPFSTLAQAQTAAAAGDTIFVFNGAYTTGITLKADQRLIGEATGLSLPVGNPSIPAGTRPVIDVASGNAVDLASGVTVSGLTVGAPAGAAFRAVGTTGGTLSDVVLGSSLVGYRLENASGLTIAGGSATALGDSLLLVPDGDFVADLTITGGTYAGVGNAAGDVALDFGSGFASGNAQLRGTVLLSGTSVTATGQDGLFVENAGSTPGTLRLVNSSITATQNSGFGLLVRADGTALPPDLSLELVDSVITVGPFGDAIDAAAEGGDGVLSVSIVGGAIEGAVGSLADDGLRVSADGAGASVTVLVDDVSFSRLAGRAVYLGASASGALLEGVVQNSQVGLGGSTGAGVLAETLGAAGTGAVRVEVVNNTIAVQGGVAVAGSARGGSSSRLDLIVTGNSLTGSGPAGMLLTSQNTSLTCMRVAANTSNAALGLQVNETSPSTFLFEGASGTSASLLAENPSFDVSVVGAPAMSPLSCLRPSP